MRILGFEISRKQAISLDTLIQRLEATYQTTSGIAVDAETCMQSPTVHAIVTAIENRISTLPVHVYRKTRGNDGRESRELLPSHPVANLLKRPNGWQTPNDYWLDATSRLVRYGNYFAFKTRGQTGPIRSLEPLDPRAVTIRQDDNLNVVYHFDSASGRASDYSRAQIHHARGSARDTLRGDSPITDLRESIALEIAAERYGSSFFAGGAMPGLVFKFAAGSAGFKDDGEREKFVRDFTEKYSGKGRFRAMLLPKGIELGDPVAAENEKGQFSETRQQQRSIIAGGFGVPPHLVGDLSKGTFNNIENQSLEFVMNVILPYVRRFESAMEYDLLTPEDRAGGVIIRFNLEGALRADFKTRQEGLKIQREMGVISVNEWREIEGRNPIEQGDDFWTQGPSGQGAPPADSTPGDSTPEESSTAQP